MYQNNDLKKEFSFILLLILIFYFYTQLIKMLCFFRLLGCQVTCNRWRFFFKVTHAKSTNKKIFLLFFFLFLNLIVLNLHFLIYISFLYISLGSAIRWQPNTVYNIEKYTFFCIKKDINTGNLLILGTEVNYYFYQSL